MRAPSPFLCCDGKCLAFSSPVHIGRKSPVSVRIRSKEFVSPSVRTAFNVATDSSKYCVGGGSMLAMSSQSWKLPRWYAHRALSVSENGESEARSQPPLSEKGDSVRATSLRTPPPKRVLTLKVLCSALLLSSVSALWGMYFSFCNESHNVVVNASTRVLGRPIRTGRLVRLLPSGGVCIGKSDLLQAPGLTTAPEISTERLNIWVTGIWGALTSGKPLFLNVTLSDAEISVHQIERMTPKGKLASQWDPGLPPPSASAPTSPGGRRSNSSLFAGGLPIQPGTLKIEKATVFLHTVALPDYGHGGEMVEVQDVSASASFPEVNMLGSSPWSATGRSFDLDGSFDAHVQGAPVGGGVIDIRAHANAQELLNIHPGSEICVLHVRGEEIRAPKIAAFLSLPFRANDGKCRGDVKIEFTYGTETLIPDMHGEAELDGVALRFHPDPKTPEIVELAGKLRFDRKDLFLDATRGTLGTLPITVVGNIDLVGDYDLLGYIPSVDVNNILETFDVEKFVPVVGSVKGEARLTGPLEEPTITGWAETTSEKTIFDRLPLSSAYVDFEWEAMAGTLKFTDIQAKIVGQGSCSGAGGLFFDMTKETPYGTSRPTHHVNSPKAEYWNPDSTGALQPLPVDELEIDDHAPHRSYDSMKFEFEVQDVNGSDLLRFYGGKYGGISAVSVGTVEGSGVLAGHAKDANCRVSWRSVSPPPTIPLREEDEKVHEKMTQFKEEVVEPTAAADEPVEQSDETIPSLEKEQPESCEAEGGDTADDPQEPPPDTTLRGDFTVPESNDYLGGGDFQGLVYIKLGDLPAARRVKVRTMVKGLDARRLGWADKSLQSSLGQLPNLNTSVDTFFKGVMHQRPIIPPGSTEVPRTPRMELLGADGALAVRRLTINDMDFAKTMAGSFSFSTSDFSMSLKETVSDERPPVQQDDEAASLDSLPPSDSSTDSLPSTFPALGDELTVSASLKGDAILRLRQRKAEVVASVSTDRSNHQVADVFARRIAIQDLMGDDFKVSGVSTVSGLLNADAQLNFSLKKGEGSVTLTRPRIGPLRLSAVTSDMLWNGQDISLLNGVVRSRNSELQATGKATMPARSSGNISWQADVDVAQGNLREIVAACQSATEITRSFDSPSDLSATGSGKGSRGNQSWLKLLSRISSASDSYSFDILNVPDGSFEEQVQWFNEHLAEEKVYGKHRDFIVSDPMPEQTSGMMAPDIVEGNVTGKLRLKYEKKPLQKKKAVLVSRTISAEPTPNTLLQDLVADFELKGKNWFAGEYSLSQAYLKGRMLNNTISIGTLRCEDDSGFFAQGNGYLRTDGSIKIHGDMEKAPAALVADYFRAPVVAGGEYRGQWDVTGRVADPKVDGSLVWTDATLNGKKLQEARSELKCVNGRCEVNVSARVGGKEEVKSSGEVLRVSAEIPIRRQWRRILMRSAPTLLNPISMKEDAAIDDRLQMNVDIRKFGLVFLNAVLPDFRLTSGSADVNMKVSGSFNLPVVKGRVSVRGVKMWPQALSQPIEAVRGEVLFDEVGTVSLKSVYGRCNGKGLHVHGDILLSEHHRSTLDAVAARGYLPDSEDPTVQTEGKSKLAKAALKALNERKTQASSLQEKVARGLTFEMGDVPISVKDLLEGTLSGKIVMKRALTAPEISGSVGISKGTVFLSNASSRGNGVKMDRDELARAGTKLQSPSSQSTPKSEKEDIVPESQPVGVMGNSEAVEAERLVDRKSSKLNMNRFRISIGRDMKIVYPFLLNLDAHGSLDISGPADGIETEGKIYFSQGQVNLLASRMDIKRGEESYARFERGSGAEPIVKIALEDDDVVVRINEAAASDWANHLDIKNKRGGELGDSSWAEAWISRLQAGNGLLSAQSALLKLGNSYVTQVAGAKGKLGELQWRLHPILGSVSGESSGNISEDVGAGGKLTYGRGSLSMRSALSGEKTFAFELRPWKWLGLYLQSEQGATRLQLEIGSGQPGQEEIEREKSPSPVEEEKVEEEIAPTP